MKQMLSTVPLTQGITPPESNQIRAKWRIRQTKHVEKLKVVKRSRPHHESEIKVYFM